MLEVFFDLKKVGKNPLKDISAFWKTCVCGNLACSYQGYFFIIEKTVESKEIT